MNRSSDDATPADRDAVLAEQWSRHYHDLVRYVCVLLSGDVHTAEDVAQETAIRLWRHPEVLDDTGSLAAWLRTVAKNIVVDRSRRQRARPPETPLRPGIDHPSPEEFDRVAEASAVDTLLAQLSPRHRAVVIEVYVHDRPVADVATELGIPTGTVKSRCHTALHRLRAGLTSRTGDLPIVV